MPLSQNESTGEAVPVRQPHKAVPGLVVQIDDERLVHRENVSIIHEPGIRFCLEPDRIFISVRLACVCARQTVLPDCLSDLRTTSYS